LLFRDRLELPAGDPQPSPCESCAAKPCLKTCPVGAFTMGRYDVVSCRSYLATLSGQPCVIQGCQARLACPVGREHAYRGGLAQHLMRAFARG
jgi:epoxyqueuosine reductase QueG